MSRNSSGSYALPTPGNPIVTGSVTNSTTMNATLTDLGNEIGSSLDRQGRGPMLAPLRGVDGTVGAPAVAFNAETGSGLYRAGANDVRLAVGGVDALKLGVGGIAGDLSLSGVAVPVIKTTFSNSQLQIQGNRAAADVGSDVGIGSSVARTAGYLAAFQNPISTTNKLLVDYQGLLTLATPATAIQPATYVTPVTPNAGWNPSGQIGYWKTTDGTVCLRGGTAFVSGTNPVFTLPTGFRPTISRTFLSTFAVGGPLTIVTITATGNVTSVNQSTGANTSTMFDGISFLAEQ